MKTCGLLFSLVLLAIGGSLLVIFNFFSLAFNWQDFLIYLVIALVVYGIVGAVGGSLDRSFNQSVKDFLDGTRSTLLNDKGLLGTFGLLLITLLPFLLYLLAFALFSAITFALYGLMLVSRLPRVPVAVLVGLAAVAFGTGLAIVIGFYRLFFPERRKTFGIELDKTQQKKLWELTEEVARELKAKPIDKIIVTPDPGIGVYQDGGLFWTILGRGRQVLEIGLPSLHDLSIDEFKAILAHEYGHFSNRDTQWNSFAYAMGNSLLSTLRSTPGPARDSSDGGGIARAIMSINPAYWMLHIFTSLYFTITSGFSRIREVMADVMAMDLYGGEAFRDGLLKVATNDQVFSQVVHGRYVPELLREGKAISNFSKFVASMYEQLDSSDIEKLRADMLSQSESSSPFDSHPPLKVRVDYAGKFLHGGERDDRPVSTLFNDWDDINERITELYNLRLIAFMKAMGRVSAAKA